MLHRAAWMVDSSRVSTALEGLVVDVDVKVPPDGSLRRRFIYRTAMRHKRLYLW